MPSVVKAEMLRKHHESKPGVHVEYIFIHPVLFANYIPRTRMRSRGKVIGLYVYRRCCWLVVVVGTKIASSRDLRVCA